MGMADSLGLWLGTGRNGGRAGSAESEKLSPRGARQKERLQERSGLDHSFNWFQAISIMRLQIVPLGIQSFQRWRERPWSVRGKTLVASMRKVSIS